MNRIEAQTLKVFCSSRHYGRMLGILLRSGDQRNEQEVETSIFPPPPPKKVKVQKSVGRVMLSVFWDSRRVILTDYLPNGETLNSEYYCNLLEILCDALKQKLRHQQRRLADNPPAHMAQESVVAVHRLGYEPLQHLSFSPDHAPSDFSSFSRWRNHFMVGDMTTDWMSFSKWNSEQSRGLLQSGLKQMKKRWQECVTLRRHNVENFNSCKWQLYALISCW